MHEHYELLGHMQGLLYIIKTDNIYRNRYVLATIGGLHNNSLNHILNADVAGKNEDIDYEITTIKHSPYLNNSEFSKII